MHLKRIMIESILSNIYRRVKDRTDLLILKSYLSELIIIVWV
jgi:hypothetical protein